MPNVPTNKPFNKTFDQRSSVPTQQNVIQFDSQANTSFSICYLGRQKLLKFSFRFCFISVLTRLIKIFLVLDIVFKVYLF